MIYCDIMAIVLILACVCVLAVKARYNLREANLGIFSIYLSQVIN